MVDRGTRLSETWIPTDKDIAYAESLGMSDEYIRLEAEKFRDYWTALPGQRALKLNWEATWRNWVRKDYGKGAKVRADMRRAKQDMAKEQLEVIAEHARRSWCRYGDIRPDLLEQCVKAGLLTEERAREVGL